MISRVVSLLVLGGAFAICSLHPYWGKELALAAIILFLASVRWQSLFFVLFPVFLVAADGYLVSGQLVIREYDSLLLASLGGGLWRGIGFKGRTVSRGIVLSGGVFVASLLISAFRGSISLPETEFRDQLSVYFSSWNVVRIGKGFGWGGLLLLMIVASPIDFPTIVRRFVLGMQLAAVYVGIFVVGERVLFESLLDLEHEFRASGPFSTMHIGDQHLDGFLVLVLPLIWYGWWGRVIDFSERGRSWKRFLWNGSLTVLILHAGVASMSRATIAVLLLQVVFLALAGMPTRWASGMTRSQVRGLAMSGFGLLVAAVVFVAVSKSDALARRFGHTWEDAASRLRHWGQCVSIVGQESPSLLLGKGMGTLPTAIARAEDKAVPPLRWTRTEAGGEVLLEPGWPIYLEHWLFRDKGLAVELELTASSGSGSVGKDAWLAVSRCSKSLLQSYDCSSEQIRMKFDGVGSVPLVIPPPPAAVGDDVFRRWRAQSVAFYASSEDSVAIYRARISSSDGKAGTIHADGFDEGTTGWCFTCDDHLVWRAKNLWVHLLFEQGLVGLVSALAFQVLVGYRLCLKRGPVGLDHAAVVVSLVGFAGVGAFGTLIDTAWLTAVAIGTTATACVTCDVRGE